MKKLLALFVLLGAGAAQAYTCNSYLESRGSILQVFAATSINPSIACNEAARQCKTELAFRQRGGRSPHLNCRTDNVRPPIPVPVPPRPIPNPGPFPPPFPPNPSNEICFANLRAQNGSILDSFTGRSFSRQAACDDARFQCQRELDFRNRTGRNPRAYCEVQNNYPTPPSDYISRTCEVDRNDRFGYRVGSHLGTATGRSYEDVFGRACEEALRQCRNSSFSGQYCVQRTFRY